MSFDGNNLISIGVALLLLIGTWVTARYTQVNTKIQAKTQLKQIDQSAFTVAESIYNNALARLTEENEALKDKNKKLEEEMKSLEVRYNDLKNKIEYLERLIKRNVD